MSSGNGSPHAITEEDKARDTNEFPAEVPILPLRGLVVYPHTAIPLTVGQQRSLKLVDDVIEGNRLVGLVTAFDPDMETPGPDDIYRVGTLAAIHRLFRAPDGTIRLLVQGLKRIRINEYTSEEPYLKASISEIPESVESELEVEALERNVMDQFRHLADLMPSIPPELVTTALATDDPLQLAYSVATYIRIDLEKAQELLELESTQEKLRYLLELLNKEVEVLELGRKIQSEAQSEMEKSQREYYLREQLKAIQRELAEGDDQTEEVGQFRKAIEEAGMSEEARGEAERELDRLSKLSVASAEYGVIRTYLDWLVNMPWNKRTDDNLDISHARQVLNEDHYGLKDIKERILEFLAVRKLRSERSDELEETPLSQVRRERQGAILCFVGPPGVGKTSLGASIARAMGRKFIRLSLGGVRDEAEIRGFRRTYIGAMPGRIVQTLRRAESRNPLIMLDEVDKLGRDFRGDPASALLELLDPEQNAEFRDTYLDVPFDLSEVFFITTANSLDTIPGPLLDRMELIQLSGYTEQEKLAIASQYLVPRQIRENGLREEEIDFDDEALLTIIRDFTREAGVRNLEREIGRAARKVVTRIAEGTNDTVEIDPEEVRDLLGKPRFGYRTELEDRTDLPGVATGLAWTPVGGDVLFIEATSMPGDKAFQYTGQLGDVMQESARIALSYIRSKAADFNVENQFFKENELHLHVPAGATPKDGPSAGVTMAVALASLLTHRPTRHNVAMTGELTLNGQVLPVGGIKDKVLAAHRIGVDTVILPKKNEPDLEELPDEVRDQMTFVLIDHVDKAFEVALDQTVA
ncbi:endopeptidase La [Phototrophicus methaneseepsis]|uniref:Lon protease n=2 Tax=Phototrophicus methaneseepsis TaxID=2710758 RepID=A0A7S8IGU3_9CHLR|nr:endopeptidase La [Phototrophicus methaneseepsis]